MLDRLVTRAWWFATMALIAAAAIGSLLACYHGAFRMISGAYGSATMTLIGGLAMGCAAFLLARYRMDLVGD